jgi:hypothetical protein
MKHETHDESHRLPWGSPGPRDPRRRANATRVVLQDDRPARLEEPRPSYALDPATGRPLPRP